MELDFTDKRLLEKLQQAFPLVEKPFDELGRDLGINTTETIERIRALKSRSVIREICAIFDSRALGYQSTLAALSLPEGKLEAAADIISRHPGVSHNYARNYKYNLWFTLALPPGEAMTMACEKLASQVGAESVLVLPAIKVFKIGAFFKISDQDEVAVGISNDGPYSQITISSRTLTPAEIALIRELQIDLPLEERPFLGMAKRLGMKESEVLERATDFLSRGVMRRFAALLFHRKLGFIANGMGCWRVPVDRIEEVGETFAASSQVTHCYQRVTYPQWTYNLFTMVHAPTQEGCLATIKLMAEKVKISDYIVLFSTREFKKATVKFYW